MENNILVKKDVWKTKKTAASHVSIETVKENKINGWKPDKIKKCHGAILRCKIKYFIQQYMILF